MIILQENKEHIKEQAALIEDNMKQIHCSQTSHGL